MEIRPINPRDLPSIARIHRESWIWAYKTFIPKQVADSILESHFLQLWKKNMMNATKKHWVFEYNNHPTGVISVQSLKTAAETSEISALYIDPGITRRGYGKLLLDHALGELTALGFKAVRLWVVRENRNARGFYEAADFTPMRIERHIHRYGIELTQLQYGRSLVAKPAPGK